MNGLNYNLTEKDIDLAVELIKNKGQSGATKLIYAVLLQRDKTKQKNVHNV